MPSSFALLYVYHTVMCYHVPGKRAICSTLNSISDTKTQVQMAKATNSLPKKRSDVCTGNCPPSTASPTKPIALHWLAQSRLVVHETPKCIITRFSSVRGRKHVANRGDAPDTVRMIVHMVGLSLRRWTRHSGCVASKGFSKRAMLPAIGS